LMLSKFEKTLLLPDWLCETRSCCIMVSKRSRAAG
jgi:hypothetical protein